MQKGNQSTVSWHPEQTMFEEHHKALDYPALETDIETFQDDGVVLIRGSFSDWVDALRSGLERNLKNPEQFAFPCESIPPGGQGRFFDSYCNWHRIPEYTAYLRESSAASMAGQFMKSNSAQFFHEHVFSKDPGTQAATPWHHDLPYYCVDGRQSVSIYVPLDSIPEDTAVRFIAGSHRWERLYFPRHFLDGSDYVQEDPSMGSAVGLDTDNADHDLRVFALEPGDTLLFDFRTLHGSTAAETKHRRRAFSTRWLGDDMVYFERPGETSPPLKDLGIPPGNRMRRDWFPVLWCRQ